jgi:hypothetical protein
LNAEFVPAGNRDLRYSEIPSHLQTARCRTGQAAPVSRNPLLCGYSIQQFMIR